MVQPPYPLTLPSITVIPLTRISSVLCYQTPIYWNCHVILWPVLFSWQSVFSLHSCSLPWGSDEYSIEDGFADGNHDRNMGEGEGDGENGDDNGSMNELDGKNELDGSEDVVEGGTVGHVISLAANRK